LVLKQDMKKYVITIGIISILGAAIAFGALVWNIQYEVPQNNQNTNVPKNNNGIDTTVLPPEDLSQEEWLTYRNEEFGFEFKYPGDWEYNIHDDGVIWLKDSNNIYYLEGSETELIVVTVKNQEKDFSFEDWKEEWLNTREKYGGVVNNISINGQEALQGIDYLGTQSIIYYKNRLYSISQVNLGSNELNSEIDNIYKVLLELWKFVI